MAWHGVAWRGMAWHGVAWRGMAWHGSDAGKKLGGAGSHMKVGQIGGFHAGFHPLMWGAYRNTNAIVHYLDKKRKKKKKKINIEEKEKRNGGQLH
jgi:hypothetical protein